MPRGESHGFEVVGSFVDLSTAVEISGSGVSVSYGNRKSGANSSIIVKFNADENAAPGERTVKMRYLIETNGPDTFKVKVVKKGSITRVQYKRQINLQAGFTQNLLSAPTSIPLNQKVVLVITGTKLNGVALRSSSNFRNQRILPGATDTQCEIELEFIRDGEENLRFYDPSLTSAHLESGTSFLFRYDGFDNSKVQAGTGQSSGTGGFIAPPLSGGSGSGNTLIDLAPRANLLNIFR